MSSTQCTDKIIISIHIDLINDIKPKINDSIKFNYRNSFQCTREPKSLLHPQHLYNNQPQKLKREDIKNVHSEKKKAKMRKTGNKSNNDVYVTAKVDKNSFLFMKILNHCQHTALHYQMKEKKKGYP